MTGTVGTPAAAAGPFQPRPVNVAVLYCIRYEQAGQQLLKKIETDKRQ